MNKKEENYESFSFTGTVQVSTSLSLSQLNFSLPVGCREAGRRPLLIPSHPYHSSPSPFPAAPKCSLRFATIHSHFGKLCHFTHNPRNHGAKRQICSSLKGMSDEDIHTQNASQVRFSTQHRNASILTHSSPDVLLPYLKSSPSMNN